MSHLQCFVHKADTCRCIWNTALPLLQHNLRHTIRRSFTTAAGALQKVGSPLHELRAMMHFELAKVNTDVDLLVPARWHAQAAAGLDYIPASAADAAHFQFDRPLDRHLDPLLESLRLRTDQQAFDYRPEEAAVLHIERAKGAQTTSSREDSLCKAMTALREVKLLQPPMEAKSSLEAACLHHQARHLTRLWGAIVKTAWHARLHSVVHNAAPYVLWFQWKAAVDRDMVGLQERTTLCLCAQIHLFDAQSCHHAHPMTTWWELCCLSNWG
jgi:hypothetical protein